MFFVKHFLLIINIWIEKFQDQIKRLYFSWHERKPHLVLRNELFTIHSLCAQVHYSSAFQAERVRHHSGFLKSNHFQTSFWNDCEMLWLTEELISLSTLKKTNLILASEFWIISLSLGPASVSANAGSSLIYKGYNTRIPARVRWAYFRYNTAVRLCL